MNLDIIEGWGDVHLSGMGGDGLSTSKWRDSGRDAASPSLSFTL
jgi:hypothetical protein